MAKSHYCRQCEDKKHGHGFMSGAVFGALIGAVLGVLYAPGPGEETRKKLKDVGDDLSAKGKKVLSEAEILAEEVKVAAAPLLEEVEKNMAPVLKKAKAQGKEVHEQVLERVEQLVDEVGDVERGAKKFFKGIKK